MNIFMKLYEKIKQEKYIFHAIRLMMLKRISIIFLLFLTLLHNFLQKYISF